MRLSLNSNKKIVNNLKNKYDAVIYLGLYFDCYILGYIFGYYILDNIF